MKTFKKAVDFLESFYGLRLREDKARRWKSGLSGDRIREYNLISPTGKVMAGMTLTLITGLVQIGGINLGYHHSVDTPKELL